MLRWKRFGQIALACFRSRREQQGITSENLKRELGHIAQEMRLSPDQMIQCLEKGGDIAGRIAWALLAKRREQQGVKYSPTSMKREIGNLSKETGVPFDELMEFSWILIKHVTRKTFPMFCASGVSEMEELSIDVAIPDNIRRFNELLEKQQGVIDLSSK